MYLINWTRKATKQLIKLPSADQIKITAAVGALRELSTAKNVKPLTSHTYSYRLRVGNYRVLFDVKNELKIISIEEVKKRDGQTY